MTMLIPIRDDNPYHRFPIFTVLIIAVNVWVFLSVGVSDRTVYRYGAVPCDVTTRCPAFSDRLEDAFPERSPWLSIFTSMFMHGGIAHLAGNMLYLWVFGNNVEDRLGRIRFLLFYFATGLAAAFAHFLVSSGSATPIVGASGAISGVLGAYYVLWPRARVLSLVPFLFFIPVTVSAGFLLGLWFIFQLLNGFGTLGSQQSGIAFMAHIGGFAAGYVLIRILAPPKVRRDPLGEWFKE